MKTIKINPSDNVAVALTPMKAGETVEIEYPEAVQYSVKPEDIPI